MAAEGPRSSTDVHDGHGLPDEPGSGGRAAPKRGAPAGADRPTEPEGSHGRRPRPKPWSPFVLLFAVGAGLLWVSGTTDLGRLGRPTAIGGGALVGIVLVLTANRLRRGGARRAARPAGRR